SGTRRCRTRPRGTCTSCRRAGRWNPVLRSDSERICESLDTYQLVELAPERVPELHARLVCGLEVVKVLLRVATVLRGEVHRGAVGVRHRAGGADDRSEYQGGQAVVRVEHPGGDRVLVVVDVGGDPGVYLPRLGTAHDRKVGTDEGKVFLVHGAVGFDLHHVPGRGEGAAQFADRLAEGFPAREHDESATVHRLGAVQGGDRVEDFRSLPHPAIARVVGVAMVTLHVAAGRADEYRRLAGE